MAKFRATKESQEIIEERSREGICDVAGCGKPVRRHLPRGRVEGVLQGERFVDKHGRSLGLCKDHYRKVKKATREDRELERAGW